MYQSVVIISSSSFLKSNTFIPTKINQHNKIQKHGQFHHFHWLNNVQYKNKNVKVIILDVTLSSSNLFFLDLEPNLLLVEFGSNSPILNFGITIFRRRQLYFGFSQRTLKNGRLDYFILYPERKKFSCLLFCLGLLLPFLL